MLKNRILSSQSSGLQPNENKSLISRDVFARKVIRFGLLALLIIISFVLWGRVVAGKVCSGCPENGFCNGRSDCNKY